MTDKIKEILEKQLELLSERSTNVDDEILVEMSNSIANIAKVLIYL